MIRKVIFAKVLVFTSEQFLLITMMLGLHPGWTRKDIQWNLDFTIWQGDSKIISLNRNIVVNELQIYK